MGFLHDFEACSEGIDPGGVIFLHGCESLCLFVFDIIVLEIVGGIGVFDLLQG